MISINTSLVISLLLLLIYEINSSNVSNGSVDASTKQEEFNKAIPVLNTVESQNFHEIIKNNYIKKRNVSELSANVTKETNSTQKYVACIPNFGTSEVQLVNDTELMTLLTPNTNVTNRETPGNCVAVLFYSKFCPFSSMAAPHFNALPRAFPDIKMVAINAMMYHLFNAQNGIVGVPSLVLFHSGRPIAKFNESEYTLELFSRFMTKYTGINAEEKSYVTSLDFGGPVTSVPAKDTDTLLGLSWAFIILCAIYYFSKSKWWKWIVETVQRNWRESEAQAHHEHSD